MGSTGDFGQNAIPVAAPQQFGAAGAEKIEVGGQFSATGIARFLDGGAREGYATGIARCYGYSNTRKIWEY